MGSGEFSIPLFPFRFRYFGSVLILIGLISGYLYYFGGRPSFFQIPVFAVMTSYVETRYFVIAQTNLLDEAAALLILTGLLFIGFSKERTENAATMELRLKALIYAVYGASAFWILLFLVIFGWPIVVASSVIFPVFIMSYILIHQIMVIRRQANSKSSETKTQNL